MADDCAPVGAGDYVVQDGDSLVSIAAAAGLLPDSVWNDPANAALKEARGDGEVLLPGDRITVRAVEAKSVDRPTGKRHVFRRKGVPAKVTIYAQDEEGTAFAGKKYELTIDGVVQSGMTGDDGKIEATIAPGGRSGELKVWLDEPGLPNPWVMEVNLGTLYPIDHTEGVRQRLANLGLGGIDVSAALAIFQAAQGLAVGEIDQSTRDKLRELYKV